MGRKVLLVALSVFGPGCADTQSPVYLSVLAIPPSTVGTCIAVPRRSGRDSLRSRDRELVMTTLDPTGRREIRVYADTTGRIGGYSDVVSGFNGSDTETGDNVVARLARDGRWRGIRMHMVVHVVGTGRGPDGRLVRRPPMQIEHTPARALTTAEQALVGELVTWMGARCPA